jgi:hypothetical protein
MLQVGHKISQHRLVVLFCNSWYNILAMEANNVIRTEPTDSADRGSEYSDEEREFLRLVENWKRMHGLRFVSVIEVLRLAKSLGYRR